MVLGQARLLQEQAAGLAALEKQVRGSVSVPRQARATCIAAALAASTACQLHGTLHAWLRGRLRSCSALSRARW